MNKDSIFSTPLEKIVDFKFDEKVANVFPDMIKRSVPGYTTIISIIGMLTEHYAQENSNCYDLGSSLGAAAFSMQNNIKHSGCKIIAVDNSEAMVNKCKEIIHGSLSKTPIEVICDDIQNVKIEKASVVVLNFTLQFIEVTKRLEIIKNIYDGMLPGGILILSEKIKFEEENSNQRQINLYHAFKRLNGYSSLEISQKRTALENVLIPETLETHKTRLHSAGFTNIDLWFRCFNFSSIIAEK